jgi:hypothetical protein
LFDLLFDTQAEVSMLTPVREASSARDLHLLELEERIMSLG